MRTSPHILQNLLDTHEASDQPALVAGNQTITYAQFASAAKRCAAALLRQGVERGDRVVIFLPRGIEECWAIFGTSRASCVLVPANSLLKSPQLKHIIRDCGAKVVISSRAFSTVLEASLDGLVGVHPIFVEDLAGFDLDGLRDQGDPCIGEDLAAILYTSGSTGLPKGVMLSHRNLLAGTRIVRNYLGITCHDRILSILPFSFDYGLNQLLTAVEQGALTVILTFKIGDDIVRALRDHSITGLAGVPTIWAILTKTAPLLPRTPLPHLRYITNSGGAVPSETVKELQNRLGDTRIYLMYGLTEAFRSTYLPPDEINRRPTSIGKSIPECEVFAVNSEGRRTKPGEPGILVHRGPTVSLGYWNRPEDTARVLRPNPLRPSAQGGDTVCYSGDLVVEDEEGFFTFVGRNDAMIKSGGYRISPTEVEEAMMMTRQFSQIAVIGLPDPLTGMRLHAVGVGATAQTDIASALREVGRNIASYMVPRTVEIVDRLPVTPNGKVDYRELLRQRVQVIDG